MLSWMKVILQYISTASAIVVAAAWSIPPTLYSPPPLYVSFGRWRIV
jgi:hypothetical protein